MKKRILATVMALTLGAAMLTACGSAADDVNTSIEADAVDTTAVPTEESTVPAAEDVVSTEEATTEDVDSTEEATAEDVDSTEEAATENVDSTEEAATENVDSTEEAATEDATENVDSTEDATTEEAAN